MGTQETNTHTVKIVDFGSAVLSSSGGSGPTSFMGGSGSMSCTPAFRSPESLQPGYRLSFQVGWCRIACSLPTGGEPVHPVHRLKERCHELYRAHRPPAASSLVEPSPHADLQIVAVMRG